MLDKLFPKWRISQTVEWYWVKVASETGQPVWSFDSNHRRCYEGELFNDDDWRKSRRNHDHSLSFSFFLQVVDPISKIGLVLGWYNPTGTDNDNGTHEPTEAVPTLPDRKVFLSTPAGHSRKPVLLGKTFPPFFCDLHTSFLTSVRFEFFFLFFSFTKLGGVKTRTRARVDGQ